MTAPSILTAVASDGSGGISETLSAYTIAAGTARMLVVCVGVEDADRVPASVTLNAVGLSLLNSEVQGTNRWCGIYYMKDADLPAAADYDIVVTLDSAGTKTISAILYQNVDQVTTPSASQLGNATETAGDGTIDVVLTSPATTNCLIVAVGEAHTTGLWSVQSGFTEDFEYSGAGHDSVFAHKIHAGASESVTIALTHDTSGTLNGCSAAWAEFIPAGGGTPISYLHRKQFKYNLTR